MSHTIKNQKKLIARIRRIKGQATALEALLESESDCAKVLQQIAAIRGAANGLMLEVLEGHMREHLLPEGMAAEKSDDMEQVLSILKSYMK